MSDDPPFETATTFATNRSVAEAHRYAQMLAPTVELPSRPTRDQMIQRLSAAGGVLAKLEVRVDDACKDVFGMTLSRMPDGSDAARLRDALDDLANLTVTHNYPEDAEPAPALETLAGAGGQLRLLLNRLDEEIQRHKLGLTE
jgi:hypothetical protein